MPIYLCRLKGYYCIDFLGRIINLSGISAAKRSRSEPNLVYVDRSRGDNVQTILGAISPFWAKWGWDNSRGALVFFLCGNPDDLSGTSQRPIFFYQIWPRNVIRCPVEESGKTFSKIFTLGVKLPNFRIVAYFPNTKLLKSTFR